MTKNKKQQDKKLNKKDISELSFYRWNTRIVFMVVIGIFTYLLFWKNLLNIPNSSALYFLFKFIIWGTVTDWLLRMGEWI